MPIPAPLVIPVGAAVTPMGRADRHATYVFTDDAPVAPSMPLASKAACFLPNALLDTSNLRDM